MTMDQFDKIVWAAGGAWADERLTDGGTLESANEAYLESIKASFVAAGWTPPTSPDAETAENDEEGEIEVEPRCPECGFSRSACAAVADTDGDWFFERKFWLAGVAAEIGCGVVVLAMIAVFVRGIVAVFGY